MGGQTGLISLEVLDEAGVLQLQLADGLESLGIPGGVKDVIEALLEDGALLQRPAGVLLMAEHDVLQNGLGHAHELRDLSIKLGAFVRQRHALAGLGVGGADYTIEGLEGHVGLLLGDLHTSNDDHGVAGTVGKAQFDVGLDGSLIHTLGIMDKGLAGLVARGQTTGDGILERLDDGRLAAAASLWNINNRLVQAWLGMHGVCPHTCISKATK